MRLAYYPGCSLKSSSTAYDVSVRAVCAELGIELVEIDDWNCCGATEAATFGKVSSLALVARNLARVDPESQHVVAPCAACFLNLRKTDDTLRTSPHLRKKVDAALAAGGLAYRPGRLKIQSLLQLLYEAYGEAGFRDRVKKPLYGLRIAPYYGCQVVRPASDFDSPEYPMKMDEMMGWLGATVVDFPLKAQCCGGHLTQISDELSHELLRRLLENARQSQADLLVCLCPMCQLNLDAYQASVNSLFDTDYQIPALFFTQVVGLALGLAPEQLGFGQEIVDAGEVVRTKVANAPPAPPKSVKKKDSKELPMPTSGR